MWVIVQLRSLITFAQHHSKLRLSEVDTLLMKHCGMLLSGNFSFLFQPCHTCHNFLTEIHAPISTIFDKSQRSMFQSLHFSDFSIVSAYLYHPMKG